MSYWDGTRWVQEQAAPSAPRPSRAASWAATAAMVVGLAAVIAPLQLIAAAHTRYQGTLVASPTTVHIGGSFDVSGCGYDTSLGFVIVGFTAGSWPSALDSNGCFAVTGIPALSGDTLAPGTYPVRAYQYVHKNWKETGETTVTVVP
jgi:hypothetical protein